MRRLLIPLLLFSCWSLSGQTAFVAANSYRNSFQVTANPQFFNNRSFDEMTRYTQPSFPEFSLRSGFQKTSFHLEPLIGFSYLKTSSGTTTSDGLRLKSNLKSYRFELGARQFLYSIQSFPLVPFVDLLFHYRIIDYKKSSEDSNSQVSNEKFRGGELGLSLNLGFHLSLSSLQKETKAEMGAPGI